MKRCTQCEQGGMLVERAVENSREVAGHLFVAFIPAKTCSRCKAVYFEASVIERFELHVAGKLADSGVSSGEAFRFMRKALGMRAVDLAGLLDVAPETVSRWETDKRSADRGAVALLGALVRDMLEGRTSTLDGLQALREPRPLAKTIRIEIAEDLAHAVGA